MSSDDGELVRYRWDGDPDGPVLTRLRWRTDQKGEFLPGWHHDPFGGLTASGPSGPAWWQMHGLIAGLGLPGAVGDDLICHRPSGTGYIGVELGSYRGHWAIDGDVASALRSGSDLITFVSGVNLGVAPPSGRSGLSLLELDEIRLRVGTIAALVLGMPPADERQIRIRFGIPREQRWLRMLDGARSGLTLGEETLALLAYVQESSLLAEEYFRECLKEMLGDHYEHVSVSTYDEFRPAGMHLLAVLGRGEFPSLQGLAGAMRHSPNRAWTYALDPALTAGPGPIETVEQFIQVARAVTMAGTSEDGLTIAVGAPDRTGGTLELAQGLAREISVVTGEVRPAMLQVDPLSRILEGTGYVPDAVIPRSPDHGTGGRPVRMSTGEQVDPHHLLSTLYPCSQGLVGSGCVA